ncbi:YebC/PmpR family DNA-binding transcriptional regulator [Candidatus Gracilibacteria bacterium 28_42_T64]|nr:YebC/PmpR family DNA-binding transcriptional regulator [Candidatus Gracilibacteria bacterium 28_42_T64]
MGRGPVVAKRRDAVNAVKGKVFSIHAKLIAIAAQSGGDPDQNPGLAAAIYKAKKEGVPNDNIERAIKKGTGEDKEAAQIVGIMYEGYAPGGVALVVNVLTDNKNRTVASMRHIFTKYGGNMGESGAVAWMFKRKGIIFIDPAKHDFESIEALTYETDAEDICMEASYIKITTGLDDFSSVENFFINNNIALFESKLDYIPDTDTEITEFEKALKFTKMMEAFNEDEDVEWVATNEVISDELQKEVDAFIEKNTFKT